MKISILSDFHFGFEFHSRLGNDSFENAGKAMEKALDSDLILVAGDIFHSKTPSIGVWAKAIQVLTKPLSKSSGLKLLSCTKELPNISRNRVLQHLPVVALHGTHERKIGDEINAVQLLERVGLLVHLHRATIVFEKDGQRVAIHGMSGVPDHYAHRLLVDWNPRPIDGCFNILMLHQSIQPFVWSPTESVSLKLENLPRGFDLIVDGHVHQHAIERVDGTTLLIPGSTVVTQYERTEADDTKGFYRVELAGGDAKPRFVPIPTRKFFYEEIVAPEGSTLTESIKHRLEAIISQEFEEKPLIRLVIRGKDIGVVERELRELERKYAERAILMMVSELEAPEISRKIELLRALRERKLSIEEIGFQLLKKNLRELGYAYELDQERLFKILCERKPDEVLNLLVGEQTTLLSQLSKLKDDKEG